MDMPPKEPKLLQATAITVKGLFGLYDHEVKLNLDERVTILHGANGVGKTMLLRLIEALFTGRMGLFARVPFKVFQVAFKDGSRLSVQPIIKNDTLQGLELTLEHPGKPSETIRLDIKSLSLDPRQRIALELPPWLIHVDEDRWFDERTQEEITSEDVSIRYLGTRPSQVRQKTRKDRNWFAQFHEQVSCHFIDVQRLLRPGSWDRYRPRPGHPYLVHMVKDNAQDLARRIGETMARYGKESQDLDQSFPRRLLEASGGDPAELPALKQTMDKLETQRKELKAIGLLDESSPFDTDALKGLDAQKMSVMMLYARDTEKKLAVLDDLTQRIKLLLDNINAKFRHKQIRIDREQGLVAEDAHGRLLDLDALSSGEQHELVLHYNLLFRVKPNTLVLVDEPELSLHLVWQKAFLADLLRVVKLADFDAVLATHSPFIVGERDDLTVPLGDPEDPT